VDTGGGTYTFISVVGTPTMNQPMEDYIDQMYLVEFDELYNNTSPVALTAIGNGWLYFTHNDPWVQDDPYTLVIKWGSKV